MELSGRIIAVLGEKSGVSSRTGNSWKMQEYVIEVPSQYPKRCVFSVFGEDKIKQLNIQNGEDITIQFDIDAREYNGRWYNDIRVYNVVREQMNLRTQSVQTPPIDSNLPFLPPTSDDKDPFLIDEGIVF